ncbi:unnamed protein product [Zymoseptoria tritici ST99CH_1A5]|uniref:Uncharacterized protein n=1 Tax=Zymoseptoria tritici ST99CH_1A5 TaxID=1276529 RepID=A0A1Y6LSH3_ZYMTR|nr:unnamed protein product [Zymoseptoria tritici ST99CH_1A5]
MPTLIPTPNPLSFHPTLPSSPSPRDPSKNTHSSLADSIDRILSTCSHKLWGFTIYRTTYSSPALWSHCLAKLHLEIEDQLRFDDAVDLLESMSFTVFDDADRFDGASTEDIRRHFNFVGCDGTGARARDGCWSEWWIDEENGGLKGEAKTEREEERKTEEERKERKEKKRVDLNPSRVAQSMMWAGSEFHTLN